MAHYWMHNIIGIPRLPGQHLLRVIRKADAFLRSAQPRPVPKEHLVRLAETSPHLLEDIGFTMDAAQSNPDQTVWISNEIEITVIHAV